jgi:hypothetical protein
MSKSRNIADSAATINYIDNVTSDVQSQLNTLTTAINNVSVTSGTLTKTFTAGESSTINLTSSVLAPVVSVTKEIPQTGVTNNNWDVNSTTENYTRLNSAAATTLDWVGFDISIASYTQTFSVTGNDTNPSDIAFNTDGTRMFIVGDAGDDINQYELTSGFDISTASFTQSFSVTAQEIFPHGIAFNTDGTRMFIVGGNGDDVNQYELTSGFDISTASYTQSFFVGIQETIPTAIAFNTDGTRMFITGDTGDDVNQYQLTSGFDISTASYTQRFSVAAQEITPTGIAFNQNGTRMFITGSTGDAVNQYQLTSGFDISTASFTKVFSVSGQDTIPTGIAFNTNGTQMFIVGASDRAVDQYELSSFLTLGTGSFASADVGKTIEANDGAFVLTATDGSYAETTAPTSYAQVASGSWEMYGVVYNAADGDLQLSGVLVNTFDVSTAVYSQAFSVAAQNTLPLGLAFNTDGTKMFIVGNTGDIIYEYTLSTGFDVSTSTFVDGFVVTGQEQVPTGMAFNTDGTKMFIVGQQGDDVNEYTLSTGFDVSTATFVDSFSVASQETYPTDIAFNTDGTKMFVIGTAGDAVREYALTTGFDVSTASFTNSFSIASQETDPQGLAFNTDGTKMFIVGDVGNDVTEYALTTGFDVSTASYTQLFSVAGQDGNPQGIAFNADGTKMFIVGDAGNSVYEYTVGGTYITTGYQPVHTTASIDSTYWTDINSMTADQAANEGNVYYAISTDDRTTWTVIENTDGERDIVRNNAGTWQYNSNGTYASETWVNGATNTELATLAEAMEGAVSGYGLANASYDSVSFNVSAQETLSTGIAFNTDGTKMFIVGDTGNNVNEYTLSTAFDVSTASFVDSFSVSAQDGNPYGLSFNPDGTKMYIMGLANDRIYQYTLSTGFDISTASYASISFSTVSQDTTPLGISFNADGTKMFMLGSQNDSVYEYNLSTAYDVSTSSFVDSLSVASESEGPQDLKFNPSGTKLFIIENVNNKNVFEYSLSTAFDISTAAYSSISFSVANEESSPRGLAFNASGTKMFIVGSSGNTVFQYSTPTYTNQMDKTQLDAVTDPNHIALGDDLDLSIIFNMTSGSTVPLSDGVAINYDANVVNKGAVLGTDYDFDAPAGDKARIIALTAGNFKVRVV